MLSKTFLRLLRNNKRVSWNTAAQLGTQSPQDGVLKSQFEDIQIPEISAPDFVLQNIPKWPDKIATECAITGRNYTYAQLHKSCRNLAKALRWKMKYRKGDVAGLLLPNVPEFPIALFGTSQAGLIATTINPIYTANEIAKQLENANVKVLITLNDFYDTALKATETIKDRKIPIITIKTKAEQSTPLGAIKFEELVEDQTGPDPEPLNPSDVFILPYSSGTTGLPKGVQLTHRNIVANANQVDHKELFCIQETTPASQEIVPKILPMFHIFGFLTSYTTLSKGGKLVTIPKFEPDTFISTLKNYKPTRYIVVPPIVLFMTNHPGITPKDLSCIETILCGAAPIGPSDVERFRKKAQKDITVFQGYGLTETSPSITSLPKNKTATGSIGALVPNTMAKVVNPDNPAGPCLGPNEQGELLVKGPQVMKGYLNNPKANEDVFVDGWFRTGDLVYYTEDNLFYIADRLKELIKVKGFQVAPAELEELLRDQPEIADAAVVGIPHPDHGEVPRAFVVPRKGSTVDPEKLQRYVASKLTSYKHLKGGVTIVDSIPKNPAGKILRRELKRLYVN